MSARRRLTAGIALLALALGSCSAAPGGRSLRMAQSDSLGANYVVTQIAIEAARALGYRVTLSTVNTTMFFLAAAQGDLDVALDINFPQQMPGYAKVADRAAIVGDGLIAGGGTNGYMIDRKTAEAYGITNIGQLRDPRIAGLFGGDGRAMLINCDASWSCGQVVDYQMKAFGLAETVHSVRGKYEALMVEAVARVQRGEPALFYSWSPSWMNNTLVPGRDVVWLPTPHDAMPPSIPSGGSSLVHGVVGCAGGQDPCRMAMAAWNYKSVAGRPFLQGHPDVRRLLESMRFPQAQWSAWEAAISRDGGGNRVVKALAAEWIAAHRREFDRWIAAARATAAPR